MIVICPNQPDNPVKQTENYMGEQKNIIMVVDDNQAILDSIELLLRDDNLVIKASDAWQAIKKLREIEPDLIFLDCMMPGFTGMQLLREIRQMRIRSRVVIITASAIPEIEEEVKLLGIDRFVHKPYDVAQILDLAAVKSAQTDVKPNM